MKAKFVFLILIFMISACTTQQAKDQQVELDLRKKVLAIHDAIMPQMETVVHRRQQLKKLLDKVDSLAALHPRLDTLAIKRKIRVVLNHLDTADQTMMDWMNKLNLNFENQGHAQIIGYLDRQHTEIRRIDSALKKALLESGNILNEKIK